ncbi:MAG: hypothetical protein ACLUDQ_01850 [Bilophila wadsworthia]
MSASPGSASWSTTAIPAAPSTCCRAHNPPSEQNAADVTLTQTFNTVATAGSYKNLACRHRTTLRPSSPPIFR